MTIETIIRPFQGEKVTPTRVHRPGVVGSPPVRLAVGLVGGTKTFPFSYSYSASAWMIAVHKEKSVKGYNIPAGHVT